MVIFCKNTVGSVFFYLACLNRKVVPLLLDSAMDPLLAREIVLKYRPHYLAAPLSEEVSFDGYRNCLAAEGYGYKVVEAESYEDVMLHGDLALLLTTSGSTGSPKLVRLSRKNIISNAKAIAEYLELNEKERPVTVLPMQYTYGLSILNSHFHVGASVMLTEYSVFHREFWDFFRKKEATSISGVPYTYEMLKRLSFFKMDLPSLKTMTQAGGKLSEHLHREFAEYAERRGKKLVVMYGQTEATARMAYLPSEKCMEKCGSIGVAIPGGRFHLEDDCGKEILLPGVDGELIYEGENVSMGYAQCLADLKRGDENLGILHTGDIARRDEEGYYYITGRKKRFLKMFGKRVNMDEIEVLLKNQYPGIAFACVGEDDRLRIYVEGQNEALCVEVEEWTAEKTGIHPRGIKVCSIAEIPKNDAGKVLYHALG